MAKKKAEETEINTTKNIAEKEPMKTLINCTAREFLQQANRIKGDVERFVKATKIVEIMREIPTLTGEETDEEKDRIVKAFNKEKWERIFTACFVENADMTMDIIAKMCFTTPEKLDDLSPAELQATAIILLADSRINDFFIGLKLWGLFGTD